MEAMNNSVKHAERMEYSVGVSGLNIFVGVNSHDYVISFFFPFGDFFD